MLGVRRMDQAELASQPIMLGGAAFVAHMSGALFHVAESTLVVADLHLGKGDASARRGTFLPPYDTRETLARLAKAMDYFEPARVVCLGDSFHDCEAERTLDPGDRRALAILQEDRDWVWISGNHDPSLSAAAGGSVRAELGIAGVTLRHEPTAGAAVREIAGHLHPVAKVWLQGHILRRPCFVANRQRLIMPAFGALTGGLNVLDEAIRPLLGDQGLSVWVLGEEGLYPIAPRLLREE